MYSQVKEYFFTITQKRLISQYWNWSLNPPIYRKITVLVENSTKKKQIFVHADGGGPAIPKDFFFIIKDGKVILSEKESSY